MILTQRLHAGKLPAKREQAVKRQSVEKKKIIQISMK